MTNNKQSDKHAGRIYGINLPTPVKISGEAVWTCNSCLHVHSISKNTSIARPLGYMKCPYCGRIADKDTKIEGADITKVDSLRSRVAVPLEFGYPKTRFGHICCHCGRSHLLAKAEYQPSAPETPDPPKEKGRLRDRLRAAVQKLKVEAPNKPLIIQGPSDGIVGVREVYIFKLEKPCKCGEKPCEQCFKFVVPGEGEFVALYQNTLFDSKIPKKPPENFPYNPS
ncbi:hypothetical protein B0J11DRAFT_503144 [Dendryphion nanum]|uniref:Probable double zinc ribbon domain-containing protein n=1 Tax=Dendryphion nanum TaxID=256645 RepID=A0A9P9E7H0_9PLEO|nr:hypothetical protein B0J11DRAFT_503144 [Dendryphion nanum]